jgi:hypothetical protein
MNYQNGKIYKLVSYQTDNIYIGSTTTSLSKRKWSHKSKYNAWKKGDYHYVTSFEIIKYDDVKIILIENYASKSKNELLARERYYIENNNCVNKNVPGRKGKEYRLDNIERIRERDKKNYNKENSAKYYQDNKLYRSQQFLCECGVVYTRQHKKRHERTKKHLDYMKNIEFNEFLRLSQITI